MSCLRKPSELIVSLNLTDRTLSHRDDNYFGAFAVDPDDSSSTMIYSWDCKFSNGSSCTDSTGALLNLITTDQLFNTRMQSTVHIPRTTSYYPSTIYVFKVTASSSSGKSRDSQELLIKFEDLGVSITCPFLLSEEKECLMPYNQPLNLLAGDFSLVQWIEVGGGYSGVLDSLGASYVLQGGYWGDTDQLLNTGKVCVLAKNIHNQKGEACILIRGVKTPRISFFTETKILEGSRIDDAGKVEVRATIVEPGDQNSQVAPGLSPYSFSFGYCSLYFARKCVGTEYLLPYSAKDVVKLSIPYLKTRRLFSLALVVKVRDSHGLEHVTYKKIAPIPPIPKLLPESSSQLNAVSSSETYFFDLSVVLHSSKVHEAAVIIAFCDSLPAQLRTRLPTLAYPSTKAALSCYIMCQSQFGTSVEGSLLKHYLESELDAERRLAQMSGEQSEGPRFEANYSNGLSGVYLSVIKASQKSFKSDIYSDQGMAGVEGSWGEWIEGTKMWTAVYTAGLGVYFRGKKYRELPDADLKAQVSAKQPRIEGVSYASLVVYDHSLSPITVANLSKLIHVLMPTNESRLLVDGMTPVCEILSDRGEWTASGRFGIYKPVELDHLPIPSCSVDRTGVFRISLTQADVNGTRGSSSEKSVRFYSYYLFYVEVILALCCFFGLLRAHMKDTLSPRSRYDYLRSLSASLTIRFMDYKTSKNLIPKTSEEQLYLTKLQQLQHKEASRYLQVTGKVESIKEKKRVIIAKEKLKKGEGTREDMELIAKMVEREMREKEESENKSDAINRKAYESDEDDEAVFYDFYNKKQIHSSQPPLRKVDSDADKSSSNFITYLQDSSSTISSKGSKNSKFGLLNKKVIQNKYAKSKNMKLTINRKIFDLPNDSIGEVPEEQLKEQVNQQTPEKIDPTQSMMTLPEVEVVQQAPQNIDGNKDKSNRKLKVKGTTSNKSEKSKQDNYLPSIKQAPNQSLDPPPKALEGRDLVSIVDIYLSVHRVFGLFYFKDPFNLSIIRMLIVLNQYLFFFISIGAVSIYTLTMTEDQVHKS